MSERDSCHSDSSPGEVRTAIDLVRFPAHFPDIWIVLDHSDKLPNQWQESDLPVLHGSRELGNSRPKLLTLHGHRRAQRAATQPPMKVG